MYAIYSEHLLYQSLRLTAFRYYKYPVKFMKNLCTFKTEWFKFSKIRRKTNKYSVCNKNLPSILYYIIICVYYNI